MRKLIAALVLVVAAVVSTVELGTAQASVSEPTVGDSIRYEFISNSRYLDSFSWYDGWNDLQRFPEEIDHHVRLNSSFRNSEGVTLWRGTRTVTSHSTYQLTGSYVTAYDEAYHPYVECRIYVNGVLTERDSATGSYASAFC